jgi:5S rRNA maturation endonuclease (ribonuclease M5)
MTIMKMKKNKTYHSYDQYQLKNLSDLVCDDIENLLNSLGIESYKVFDKMVTMSCPIHGGDNDSALNLYYKGDSYRGNWKCRTHQCENIFKSSIIGFIRGCLSKDNGWNKEGDDMVSFKDAIDFAIQFSNHDPVNDKQTRKVKEKNTFVNTVKNISIDVSDKPNEVVVPRNLVIKALDIPSQYFLDRGFSKEILIKYDVGDCINSSKEMNNRAVVPVYDQNMRGMIGCTGRSIHDKCLSCNAFHNMNDKCPNDNEKWLSSKWRHSKNFKTQEHLYNYWFAKKYILASKTVVIVESPGNVWRLEEAGIHNSVAIFGSSLGYKQKALLDISGAMNIITIMDNDKAGKDAAKQIEDKCGRIYNIKHIEINANDIAEMSIDDIVTKISPQIKEYELC